MALLSRIVRSPRTLLIFEAAARLGSCSAAAREFNLTQPSISRNIADLETALDVPLFVRSSVGLTLTADGERLYRTLTEALHRIDDVLGEIGKDQARKQLVELSLSTAFVTHWFVPRMRNFQASFPDVDLRFQLISGSLRGSLGAVDLAMRRCIKAETDAWTWPFAPEIVLPVCSPGYLAQHGPIDNGPLTRRHVLLQFADSEINWRSWLSKRAAAAIPAGNWIEFSDYAVAIQTAMSGQGIALGWVSAVSRLLIEKSLVPASTRRIATGGSFALVAPRGRPTRDIVLRIRDWMMAEMRQDLSRLAELWPEGASTTAGSFPLRASVRNGG